MPVCGWLVAYTLLEWLEQLFVAAVAVSLVVAEAAVAVALVESAIFWVERRSPPPPWGEAPSNVDLVTPVCLLIIWLIIQNKMSVNSP